MFSPIGNCHTSQRSNLQPHPHSFPQTHVLPGNTKSHCLPIALSQDVVRTIVQEGGVKHLVAMSTNEHVIMQNESLVALGVIAALDLGKGTKGTSQQRVVILFPPVGGSLFC